MQVFTAILFKSVSHCKNLQYKKNFLSFIERIVYNHSNTNLEKIARQINIS